MTHIHCSVLLLWSLDVIKQRYKFMREGIFLSVLCNYLVKDGLGCLRRVDLCGNCIER